MKNLLPAKLNLPGTAWSGLDKALASFQTAGARYLEAAMKTIDRTE